MRYFRIVFSLLLCFTLLSGCGKPATSEPPATADVSGQAPTSGAPILPLPTNPASTDIAQIPAQNTLQAGNPKTLSDWVFTNYEQTFTWRDGVNNFCSVSITLPALTPVADFAIAFNEAVAELGNRYIAEVVECQQLETSNILCRITYEAYLHDEILSIVLVEDTAFDYTSYYAWSFDLEDREELSIAELCDELLDMDYPEFILATNAITAHHFKTQFGEYITGIENQPTSTDSYFETEPPAEVDFYHELLEQIPYDTVSIANRQLFMGENGQVMLIYDAPSLAGASYYPTIIPFDLEGVDWKKPTEETAYGEMLRLTEYVDGEYADSYAQILLEAFLEDSGDFIKYSARATAARQEAIVSFLNYGLQSQNVERFQHVCSELLTEDDLSASEIALINRLVTLTGN